MAFRRKRKRLQAHWKGQQLFLVHGGGNWVQDPCCNSTRFWYYGPSVCLQCLKYTEIYQVLVVTNQHLTFKQERELV